MGFGGPVIKEGLILVISIVTLQNWNGDLGEVCGKYAGWLKVPGPLYILPFFTQLPILFTYIDIYCFFLEGAVIKEGLILGILIVTPQNWYGDLGEVCGKYAGWLKVAGPLYILPIFTQLPILLTYIDTLLEMRVLWPRNRGFFRRRGVLLNQEGFFDVPDRPRGFFGVIAS